VLLFGIKFCGGCNPRYNRRKILNLLREEFKDTIKFETASESRLYEGLIVLCGCPSCCASYNSFKTKRKPILIWDEKQYNDIVETIKKEVEG